MYDVCKVHVLPYKSSQHGRGKDLLGSVTVCDISAAFYGIVGQMRRHIFLQDLTLVEMGQNKRTKNKMEVLWPSRLCSSSNMYQNSVLVLF
jgi:hypothetical protein